MLARTSLRIFVTSTVRVRVASTADWIPEEEHTLNGGDASGRRARGFHLGSLVRRLTGLLRRTKGAPPAPKSLIYALCEEYRRFDLWTAYYAFRLDPRARTWKRLRYRNVPWQREQTVEALLLRMCPVQSKPTPDAAAVGLALITAAPPPLARSRRPDQR